MTLWTNFVLQLVCVFCIKNCTKSFGNYVCVNNTRHYVKMNADKFTVMETYLTRNAVAIADKLIGIPLTYIKFIKGLSNDSRVESIANGFDTGISIGVTILAFIQDIENKSESEIAIPSNVELYAFDIVSAIGSCATPTMFTKLYDCPSIKTIIIKDSTHLISRMIIHGNALLMEHVCRYDWFRQGIEKYDRNNLLRMNSMYLNSLQLIVQYVNLTNAELGYALWRAETELVTDVALYLYDVLNELQKSQR